MKTLRHQEGARNLLYRFLIRAFCGPLGKGVWMEFPDCCLKGVKSLLKNKDPNEVCTGFRHVSKCSQSKCVSMNIVAISIGSEVACIQLALLKNIVNKILMTL